MTKRHVIFAGIVWLGLLGFAGIRIRTVWEQRAQREALWARQHQLEAEASNLRRELTAVDANLAEAEQQLAALAAPKSGAPDMPAEHRDEITRWLARVQKLRQLFANNPRQRVPEMQFLKEDDWLRVAKNHPMETDEDVRSALGEIRSQGIGYFADRVSAALRKYNVANKSERPATVQALLPYFDAPVDPAMLEDFAIFDRPSNLGGTGSLTWVVANKSPIDPDYDTRFNLTGSGGTSGAGLLMWMPELMDRYRAAATKFRRANPGQASAGIDDFLPYFDPPLERELAAHLRKAERRP